MYDSVKMVHFEPTQLCQASCPMCDRNKNGGEVNQYLKDESMTLEGFKKAFSPEFLSKIKTFFFCGNHGDPIFAPDMLEQAEYVRECNPSCTLFVTTNGGARKPEWWERLAKVVSFVNFSVDGLQDTNHFYRQGVKWEHVEENMAAFCDAGGYAKWTFLVFNYNEHQVKQAEMFSQILGVKEFIVKKSGRYINTANLKKKDEHQAVFRGKDSTRLSPPRDPKYRNKAIDEDYDKIVKTYGSMDKFIDIAEIKPKCVQKREIYVSAEGLVYPCCWLAGQVYKWWRPMEDSQEYKVIQSTGGFERINIHFTPLEEILNGDFFKAISSSWDVHGVSQGRLKTCGTKCNVGFDPFVAQWK
jgi:MoaA/NifB/PqqE/SkfB family radical SAM enzyme